MLLLAASFDLFMGIMSAAYIAFCIAIAVVWSIASSIKKKD